ncbi:hypothetical protein ABFG93_08795 [Pseudalkalibacillus hwajinpoensis]|uniref:hypothetical protein n=1 Tax=Guptibacillus hwajinpoensis TaxID=208199 RepID=UPI00325C0E6F
MATELMTDFWRYVLFVAAAGALGGIGNILISGEFQPWRKVVNRESHTVHYSIGSVKEPFVGAIGGVLTTLLFVETASAQYLLYISMLTGFGSSAFLKRYIDQKTDQIIEQSNTKLEGENIQSYQVNDEGSGDKVSMVKGVMSPSPAYLTEEEQKRLADLQSSLGEAIGPKEAKVYQCEINALINRGKQRSY